MEFSFTVVAFFFGSRWVSIWWECAMHVSETSDLHFFKLFYHLDLLYVNIPKFHRLSITGSFTKDQIYLYQSVLPHMNALYCSRDSISKSCLSFTKTSISSFWKYMLYSSFSSSSSSSSSSAAAAAAGSAAAPLSNMLMIHLIFH